MDQRLLRDVRTLRYLPRPVERAINATFSRGPGYEELPPGPAYQADAISGYYIDFSAKTRSPAAADTERMLTTDLVQLALGWWERSIAGERGAEDAFLRLCGAVEERGQRVGSELRWPLTVPVPKYRLRPGWCSCLTQGQAASIFVRAWVLARDDRYADIARRALAPLVTKRSSELVSQTAAGPVLQEAPSTPASHVLNGWISALWGLLDVGLGLGDEAARHAFEDGVESLRLHLPAYDTGWWSRYSLYPHPLEDLAKPIYHRFHVHQLRLMHELTGVTEFAETATRWAAFDRPAHVALALGQKALFAVADRPGRRRWAALAAATVT